MNYIAHIHIAQHTGSSLLGNFLGDFVKGSQLSDYSPKIQHGIKLHRKIDIYTDQHPEVLNLKRLFPAELRRTAGIALDIYFDHLLLNNWSTFSTLPSKQLLTHFYQQLDATKLQISERFVHVRFNLLKHQWLNDYQQEDVCLRAMFSIEQRLQGKISFASASYKLLCKNRNMVEQSFLRFYAELLAQSAALSVKLS
ncbi:MAG: acyl carrier protein phosphodiesterase [Paraglaciecola sp.]|jgi:acyl carrier protein phosphodiesterase